MKFHCVRIEYIITNEIPFIEPEEFGTTVSSKCKLK